MAFKLHGSLDAVGAPVLRKIILASSVTHVLMDATQAASGFLTNASMPGDPVVGHVIAHVSKEGMGLLTTGAAGAAIGSYAGTYATASDNTTVLQVAGLVDISKNTLYSVVPSAAIGTTTGSNLFGYRTDLSDAATTDESSATFATAQYLIWGVDPKTAANQIVNIYESGIFGV